MSKQCDCRICRDHRRWMAAIDPQTEEARLALDEILGNLAGAETDATFWKMKYEGTWDRMRADSPPADRRDEHGS